MIHPYPQARPRLLLRYFYALPIEFKFFLTDLHSIDTIGLEEGNHAVTRPWPPFQKFISHSSYLTIRARQRIYKNEPDNDIKNIFHLMH